MKASRDRVPRVSPPPGRRADQAAAVPPRHRLRVPSRVARELSQRRADRAGDGALLSESGYAQSSCRARVSPIANLWSGCRRQEITPFVRRCGFYVARPSMRAPTRRWRGASYPTGVCVAGCSRCLVRCVRRQLACLIRVVDLCQEPTHQEGEKPEVAQQRQTQRGHLLTTAAPPKVREDCGTRRSRDHLGRARHACPASAGPLAGFPDRGGVAVGLVGGRRRGSRRRRAPDRLRAARAF